MKKIEELLKQDWYLKLNEEGVEITPEMGKAGLFTQKQFIADIEAKVRKERQMQEMRQTEQARDLEFQVLQQRQYEERDQGQDGVIAASVTPTAVWQD